MVRASHQGRGYGTAALNLAIEEMRVRGAHRIRTMHKPTNAAAARLYDAAGFPRIGILDDGDIELEIDFSGNVVTGSVGE